MERGQRVPRRRDCCGDEDGVTKQLMKADEIIKRLKLTPHQSEGGYYVETYRSAERHGDRSLATAIYYLLTPKTFSAIHRVKSDETWHFYLGDPVELLMFHPNGPAVLHTIGTDLAGGQRPQVTVPKGSWQGARLVRGGAFALLGTTCAPGFDFDDFKAGRRAALTADYPAFAQMIKDLTRE